jgi:hypothetical protein
MIVLGMALRTSPDESYSHCWLQMPHFGPHKRQARSSPCTLEGAWGGWLGFKSQINHRANPPTEAQDGIVFICWTDTYLICVPCAPVQVMQVMHCSLGVSKGRSIWIRGSFPWSPGRPAPWGTQLWPRMPDSLWSASCPADLQAPNHYTLIMKMVTVTMMMPLGSWKLLNWENENFSLLFFKRGKYSKAQM